MRKPIYALALCSTTLVLMAGRCSDDKESKPAEVSDDAGETDGPGGGAKDGLPGDKAPGGDANAKDPDELFRDPLDAPDPAGAGGADLNEPLPGDPDDGALLGDPNVEPDAPLGGGSDL